MPDNVLTGKEFKETKKLSMRDLIIRHLATLSQFRAKVKQAKISEKSVRLSNKKRCVGKIILIASSSANE